MLQHVHFSCVVSISLGGKMFCHNLSMKLVVAVLNDEFLYDTSALPFFEMFLDNLYMQM